MLSSVREQLFAVIVLVSKAEATGLSLNVKFEIREKIISAKVITCIQYNECKFCFTTIRHKTKSLLKKS